MKKIWILAISFTGIFLILLAIQMDFPMRLFSGDPQIDLLAGTTLPESDTWMNIFLKKQKIGYAHSVFSKKSDGYKLSEVLFMRLNMMGISQDLEMETRADLKTDLTLSSFIFSLNSGRFRFTASGTVRQNNFLVVKTDLSGTPKETIIELEKAPYVSGGILYAAATGYRKTGAEQFTFHIFDPSTMGQAPVNVSIVGEETIELMGEQIKTIKLTIDFKGALQTAWMDQNGEVIKETGLLGLTLEKTTREDAYAGISDQLGEDITQIASLESNKKLKTPRKIKTLTIALENIDYDNLDLDGGRQSLSGNTLTISKESKSKEIPGKDTSPLEVDTTFLSPEAFIQSDHPKIQRLAAKIVSKDDTSIQKTKKLVDWMFDKIEKRPVLSVPDALTTLENREGDCNEHAMLFAALARAAGIPAKIEAGLVYLRGRFYYHAWNSVYADRWITVDSVFGQFPADATHIRIVSGSPNAQLDLMPVIDRLKIKVLDAGY